MDELDHIGPFLKKIGPFWSILEHFEPFAPFEPFWTISDQIRAFRTMLGHIGTLLDHIGFVFIILDNFG